MREYNYRSCDIPKHLKKDSIKNEFENNKLLGKYDSNSKYNDKELKDSLKKLYNHKCAYCESTLKNSFGQIEHYRPKKSSNLSKCDSSYSYYWLAFSWDNLLPVCEICNNFKSSCFDIEGERVDLKDEDNFESLHTSLKKYNSLEKPKLLHPEVDKFEEDILFDRKGFISSQNTKVCYTVEICNLNRENLSELREKIITDYKNKIKKIYEVILEFEKKEKLEVEKKYLLVKLAFDDIFNGMKKENQFSIVSLYIYNNFEEFIDSIVILKEIDKIILKKLWEIYIKKL